MTKDFIKSLNFDTGYFSFGCYCYAEGTDIVPKAIEFLKNVFHFGEDFKNCKPDKKGHRDKDYKKHLAELEIVQKAESDPENYDVVKDLCDLISERIIKRNDSVM